MNKSILVFFIFLLLLFTNISSKDKPAAYNNFCQKGVYCLYEELNSDSATTYFLLAHTRGLPLDSLYYFLGETYRVKGTFDSALVLNYAIKEPGREQFHVRVLKQRFLIYTGLGWTDLAAGVLDSLRSLKQYKTVSAIPKLDIGMSSGYATNNYTYNTTVPWNIVDKEFRSDMNGVLYNTDAVLRWDFPSLPKDLFTTGAGFHIDKPYWTGHTLDDIDSISIAGNIFFGLNNLFDHLNWLYDAKYKRYYNTSSVLSNFTSLSYNRYNASTLWFLTGAYSLDLDNEYRVDNHTFYLLSYNEFFLRKKWGINLLLSMTGYVDDMFHMQYFSRPTYIYFVAMNGNDVDYYMDDTFSEKLDTSNISWAALSRSLLNTRDSLYISRTLPQKHFRYTTAGAYTYPFRPTFTGRIGLQWQLIHYPEAYRWMSLDESTTDSLSRGKALAMNAADRKLYYFDEIPRVAGLGSKDIIEIISSQTAAITQHRAKRIDNTITLTAAVEKKFRRMGSLELIGTGYKTWSNLSADAPVDLPSLGGSIALQWKKDITFIQG